MSKDLDKKLGMSLEDLISAKSKAAAPKAATGKGKKQAPKSLVKGGAAGKKMAGKKAPISIAKGAAVRDLGVLAAHLRSDCRALS
jgi:hypothetical protein